MKSFKNYLVNSFRELNHVTWPTQQELIRHTILVIIGIVLVSALVGVVDFTLSYLYTALLGLV
jgi:preprotein translocase SecE subunit